MEYDFSSCVCRIALLCFLLYVVKVAVCSSPPCSYWTILLAWAVTLLACALLLVDWRLPLIDNIFGGIVGISTLVLNKRVWDVDLSDKVAVATHLSSHRGKKCAQARLHGMLLHRLQELEEM